MTITIVRHGQTEENYLNKIQGTKNNLLNDTGRRQCQRLRDKIKDKHYDYCYTSPLIRCVETAMILIGDRVEMIRDDRLIEREMGELEGRPREEYNAYSFWDYKRNRNEYGVESIQDIFKRSQEFLDYIIEKHKGQDILIVTHGAVCRAMRHILLKNKLEGNLLDIDIDNCFIEEFEV